jgi:hypothetical protein
MSITLRTHPLFLLSSFGLLFACSGSGPSAEATDDSPPSSAPAPTNGATPTSSAPPSGAPAPSQTDDVEQRFASLSQSLVPSDSASVSDEPSYFELRRDVRRCAAPLCGGFFVSRVNRLTTVCVDGSRSAECYVADLDLSALGSSSEQEQRLSSAPEDVLLRGEIVPQSTDFGELGRLTVAEAWQGHAGIEASGAFLRVLDEGIVCITQPCLSLSAELLNSRLPEVPIAEVNLDAVGSDPSDAFEQLNESEGLLVAALPTIVSGPGGRALGLIASEYYIPLSAPQACGSRGLGQCAEDSFCSFPPDANCGRADAPGTCAPKPEACTFVFDPVCGCDGQTYGNACIAASSGVSVEFPGECPASSD